MGYFALPADNTVKEYVKCISDNLRLYHPTYEYLIDSLVKSMVLDLMPLIHQHEELYELYYVLACIPFILHEPGSELSEHYLNRSREETIKAIKKLDANKELQSLIIPKREVQKS